jgi:hypothetical protein
MAPNHSSALIIPDELEFTRLSKRLSVWAGLKASLIENPVLSRHTTNLLPSTSSIPFAALAHSGRLPFASLDTRAMFQTSESFCLARRILS